MTDSQILSLYLDRNETAIEETSVKYGPYLSKIAYNITSDTEDSRECVNDTYLKAWNSIPPHRPNILSTYLGKITRNLAIDIFRKKHSTKRIGSEYALSLSELNDTFADNNTPETVLDRKLLDEVLNKFLLSLPDDARNLFIGRYYFFDPLKKAASYCGMSESKAKSILYRTRLQLRDYLLKEGFKL